jgi:Fe2+ transport system protein FeoA
MHIKKTLNCLNDGDIATLKDPSKMTNFIVRLLEMGMTKNTFVLLVRRDISKNILQLKIKNDRICINKEQALLFPVKFGAKNAMLC